MESSTLDGFASDLYNCREVSKPPSNDLTEKEQVCIDEISSHTGLEYVDRGSGRIVMRESDTVFKFARGGKGKHFDGKRQNKTEIYIWNENTEVKYLAEPLDWNDEYLWVKYRYIPPISEHPDFDESDAVRVCTHIRNKVSHIDKINIIDIRRENVGVRDEKARIIDYGSLSSE